MESALMTAAAEGRFSSSGRIFPMEAKNEKAPRPKMLSRSSVLPDAVGPVTMMTLTVDEPIIHLLAENLLGCQGYDLAVVFLDLGRLQHGQLECPPVDGDGQFV